MLRSGYPLARWAVREAFLPWEGAYLLLSGVEVIEAGGMKVSGHHLHQFLFSSRRSRLGRWLTRAAPVCACIFSSLTHSVFSNLQRNVSSAEKVTESQSLWGEETGRTVASRIIIVTFIWRRELGDEAREHHCFGEWVQKLHLPFSGKLFSLRTGPNLLQTSPGLPPAEVGR